MASAPEDNTPQPAEFEQPNFWNARYARETGFVYGREPNIFFKETLDALAPGKLLTLAEGEGRNAVYAAQRGWRVTATDFSAEARDKALGFAAEAGVRIAYEVADANAYATEVRFDLIAIVYLHLNPGDRAATYRRYAGLLAPGGRLLVTAYSPRQLGRGTGGPKAGPWLIGVEDLRSIFSGLLVTERLEEVDEEIHEGAYHKGLSSLVKYVGRKG